MDKHIIIRFDETALHYLTDEECKQLREYADQLSEKVSERSGQEG